MANHRRHGTDLPKNSPPTSTANGCVKKTSEAKKEQSESSDEEEGTVQADFAFFDPKPDDFHGVKPLLQTYLDDRKRHSPPVGTVVKIEADEDNGVFTLATALNLERYKASDPYLVFQCQEKDVKDDLGSHLGKEEKSVGHLVSQRLTNLPLQLLPPLYDAVFDEVSWDTEDDPTAELRNFSRLYLFIFDEAIIFIKPEDDIFHKLSSWSFEFPLHTEQPTLEASSSIGNLFLRNYQQMGLVMDVKAGQIPTFRQQLKSVVDESRF
ncbi:BCCIP-like protein [Pyrus ussuriensis x Pyrus communis]|uniref:BCCIP-like protein n=1 Tax=Pyrus ussuriensis x Pyrus communis TaxID=2448454 RepID=A0A5N5GWP2_9ROSA|nr:BCCIP-like protein [Pyrus ussuriensis x Pyrus communis]